MKLHTYLNYGGNCAEAFRFYEQHLGGKIVMMMTWAEMPEPKNVPPGMEKAILHARLDIGETILMGSDVPPERFQPMRSAYLSLSVDSIAEAERIYALLSDGGEIFMPMAETFFAFRFAMLRDKFGTSWMIIHERPMPHKA
jgi:PhnB protein